jgi:hypothetical protein
LDSSGTLETVFAETLAGELKNVELPAGVWQITTKGSGPFALWARRQSDGESFSSEDGSLEFVVDETGPIDLTVVGDPKSRLVEVVAHRSPG